MMEKWVPIKGYEGYYEVSSEGNVRSVDRVIRYKNGHYQRFKSRILKPKITMQGYEQVDLSKNNKVKQVKVHRLVAENFVSNPYGKPQINHIDGIKLNNSVRNLEWCTASENSLHAHKSGLSKALVGQFAPNAKLKDADVFRIKKMMLEGKKNIEISKIFNISSAQVSKIKTGKQWSQIKI